MSVFGSVAVSVVSWFRIIVVFAATVFMSAASSSTSEAAAGRRRRVSWSDDVGTWAAAEAAEAKRGAMSHKKRQTGAAAAPPAVVVPAWVAEANRAADAAGMARAAATRQRLEAEGVPDATADRVVLQEAHAAACEAAFAVERDAMIASVEARGLVVFENQRNCLRRSPSGGIIVHWPGQEGRYMLVDPWRVTAAEKAAVEAAAAEFETAIEHSTVGGVLLPIVETDNDIAIDLVSNEGYEPQG